ncbi:hypothetical protein SDC9_164958 [bioreactor metagenome]|uniref:Uncharacterized protein n=1 Tax=bioreactor metagenome TaxID=1076179 RepID=A0A645G0B6_9ZZZZ
MQRTTAGLDDGDDIESRWQHPVQRLANLLGIAPLAQPQLDVLGFAGGTGRRSPRVGDPRVRREPRRVGHRDARAAQRPLQGASEIAVAGEPGGTTLHMPEPQLLHGRWLLGRLWTCHVTTA